MFYFNAVLYLISIFILYLPTPGNQDTRHWKNTFTLKSSSLRKHLRVLENIDGVPKWKIFLVFSIAAEHFESLGGAEIEEALIIVIKRKIVSVSLLAQNGS